MLWNNPRMTMISLYYREAEFQTKTGKSKTSALDYQIRMPDLKQFI